MRTSISRTYELQCAHHLPNVSNDHKCRRVHGHTWLVDVLVGGDIDPARGWFLDFADVDSIWNAYIHEVIDHRDLNDFIPNPTTENLCAWIASQLVPHLPGLVSISARENRRSCVTVEL